MSNEIDRSQFENLMQEKRTAIKMLGNGDVPLLKALETNRLNEKIASWNGNLQLVVPLEGLMKGSIQGVAQDDVNIAVQYPAQAANTAKSTYDHAGVYHTFRYNTLIKKLKSADGMNMLSRQMDSQIMTYREMLNIAMWEGSNGQICDKASNAASGSTITVPADADQSKIREGLAIEWHDGTAGWASAALSAGYYGIISAIAYNADGSLTLTCVRSDGTTAAAFTDAHTDVPFYLLACYGKLPYGMRDLFTAGTTIGGTARSGTRYDPIALDVTNNDLFKNDPAWYIAEIARRVNAKGAFKVDMILTDGQTHNLLAAIMKKQRTLITEYKGEKLLGFSADIEVSKGIGIFSDDKAPLGGIKIHCSKNFWVAPLGDDRPDYQDSERDGIRVPGYLSGEIVLGWNYQTGLYDLGQCAELKNAHIALAAALNK